MSSEVKMEVLRALVTECLSAAAEEILRLVHRTLVLDPQICTKWVVDEQQQQQQQQLDGEHTEPEPLEPESDGEDLKVCWEIHIDDPLAAPTPNDANHSEDVKMSISEPHRNVGVSADTDCGADWSDELSSGAVACESPQPLCLFRVQPVTPEHSRRTSAPKKSKAGGCAGSNQPSSHSNNLPKNNSQSKPSMKQKPFKCPCCIRSFSLTKTLIRHMKVHAESYQCSVCGKCFCQKSHLVTHMRVHTGERPFHCQFCPETFSHKRSLANHINKYH